MLDFAYAVGNWELTQDQLLSDLQAAVELQRERCEIYRFLCDRQGFRPEHLKDPEGIARAPYITSNAFKESRGLYERLLTVPRDEISCWTVSTGTSGDRSVVGRTDAELTAVGRAYRAVLSGPVGEGAFDESLLLFPEPSSGSGDGAATDKGPREPFGLLVGRAAGDARDAGLRRYLARLDRSQGLALDVQALLERLRALDEQGRTVYLGGPPALLLALVRRHRVSESAFSFGDRCKLQLGGGGWEVVEHELQLDSARAKTELVGRLCRMLGIDDAAKVDDCYGATETTAALSGHFSAEHSDFLFHQPPWTRLIIRDPQTLAPVIRPGGVGLLEVVTPYGAGSYAGVAILMDDVAELVSPDRCPECGRGGVTLRILGRASRTGGPQGGCGSILQT